eukprot:7383488-Prymnesium_polylepis.1
MPKRHRGLTFTPSVQGMTPSTSRRGTANTTSLVHSDGRATSLHACARHERSAIQNRDHRCCGGNNRHGSLAAQCASSGHTMRGTHIGYHARLRPTISRSIRRPPPPKWHPARPDRQRQ